MSKTASASFRDRNLWADDVSLSILLAELLDVVQGLDPAQRPPWLTDLVPVLGVHAVAGADLHLDLDLGLTSRQRDHLLRSVAVASRRLRERGPITAADAADWQVQDRHPVIWRPATATDTAPIAALGEAIIGLVRGALPRPQPGTWWFIGMEGGPSTIAMGAEGSG